MPIASTPLSVQQLACLKMEELFAQYPELISIRLTPEHVACDGGGGFSYLQIEMEIAKGDSVPSDSGPRQCRYEWERSARKVLEPWAAQFRGELATRDDLSVISKRIMGIHEYEKWQAQRVRDALEAEVPGAGQRAKGGLRV